jgi:hypothetical protein
VRFDSISCRAAIAVLLAGTAQAALATTVTANNPAGDAFTNPTAVNLGQAVGSSGWYYNNVRASGTVGIDSAYPRSGNGSVHMSGPANAKADIEYLPNAVPIAGNYNSTSSLGKFSTFSSMSYDWLRNSSSTAQPYLMPALRILLDADGDLSTINDRGGLVFERVYNDNADLSAVPTNAWTSQTIGSGTFVWNFGLNFTTARDINGDGYGYDETLAQWKAFLPNAVIIGFSSGIGSGWAGTFDGAVDNIAWTIGGTTTSTNFERVAAAAVPEPETLGLMAIALIGLGLTRRRAAR